MNRIWISFCPLRYSHPLPCCCKFLHCTVQSTQFAETHYDILHHVYGRNNWQLNVKRSSTVVTIRSISFIIIIIIIILLPFCWSFLSFLVLYTVGRTPWTGDQPVAWPLPTRNTSQAQNKHTNAMHRAAGKGSSCLWSPQSALTCKNCAFCPKSVFICFIWLMQKPAINSVMTRHRNHPFYLVEQKPWPLTRAIGKLVNVSGIIK
jgi:hypothetical protein